jgi:hypothetical protein
VSLRDIDCVEEIHRYLQAAMRLEHSTIPLYLSALHSIHPSTNVDATGILKMVTAGEMLHLTLVVNMLHAVGGAPDLTVDGFVARYPTHLPDGESDFKVSIKPFSPAAIRTFLQIECPMSLTSDIDFVNRSRSPRALLPGYRDDDVAQLHFYSVGEFHQRSTAE